MREGIGWFMPASFLGYPQEWHLKSYESWSRTLCGKVYEARGNGHALWTHEKFKQNYPICDACLPILCMLELGE